jgi:hypothetical protein
MRLHNLVAAGDPLKHEIERCIRAALSGLDGEFTVALIPEGSWWLLTIEGPYGLRRFLRLDPDEQVPEFIEQSIRRLLAS